MTALESIVDMNGGWNNPLYLAVGAIALVAGAYVLFRPKVDEDRLPVAPDMSFLDFIKQLVGSRGPQFSLQIARDIGYIYRVPGLTTRCWVMVGDAKIGKQILEDPRSLKVPELYELFDKAVAGQTFFSQEGPRANHVRKSTASAFSPANVKGHMAKIVAEVVDKWIETRLHQLYVNANQPVDMDEEMMLVTTDVIARAAFDYPLTDEERTQFGNKMHQILQVFFHQGLNPLRRFFGGCFADIRLARRNAIELKTKFGYRLLEACRNNPNRHPNSVVALMMNDEEYECDEQRVHDIMLYFFGGYETTAHSISYVMLELARHPEEQTKLRSALKDMVAKYGENADLKLCPQLKYVTREVLRMHNPAALGPARVAAGDIFIPNTSRHIPKGSICSIVNYIVMRNHNVFEDPDSFVPGRWECPSEAMQRAYIPFALGKRNCQGQALASLELNTVVAKVVQSYNLEVVDEGQDYFMVTMRPKGSKLLLTKLENNE